MTSDSTSRPRWARRLLVIGLSLVALALVGERLAEWWLTLRVEARIATELEAVLPVEVESHGIELSLLSGQVALLDVAIHHRGRVAGVEPGEPFLSCTRLAVELDWAELLDREFDLVVAIDGLRVLTTRAADGTSNWEALVSPDEDSDESGALETEKADGEDSGWSISIAEATLRDAEVVLRTDAISQFEPIQLQVPLLELRGQPWRFSQDHNAIQAALRVESEGGPVDLTVSLAKAPEGWTGDMDIVGRDVEIGPRAAPIGAFGRLAGKSAVDFDLHYALRPGGRAMLTGDVTLRHPRLQTTTPPHTMEVESLTFTGLAVDFDELAVTVEKVALSDGGVRIGVSEASPPEQPVTVPGEPAPVWRWHIASLEAAALTISGGSSSNPPILLGLVQRLVAQDMGSDPEARGEFELSAARAPRGTFEARGHVRSTGTSVEAAWRELALAPLVDVLPWSIPIEIESGITSGSLALRYAPTALEGESGARLVATLTLHCDEPEIVSLAPGEGRWLSLSALELSESEIRWPAALPATEGDLAPAGVAATESAAPEQVASPEQVAGPEQVAIRLGSITLRKPRLEIRRSGEGAIEEEVEIAEASATEPAPGMEPEPALEAEVATEPSSEVAPGGVLLEIGHVILDDARIRFVSSRFSPELKIGFNQVSGRIDGIEWPGTTIESFLVKGTPLGRGSVTLTGKSDPTKASLVAEIEEIAAALFGPILRETSGYEVVRGRLSLRSVVEFDREDFESDNRLVFHDVRVRPTSKDRPVDAAIGMPLDAALALLRDIDGNVVLRVPVSGHRDQVILSGTNAIRAVLRETLPGVAASPFKLAEGLRLGTSDLLGRVARVAGVDLIPGVAELLDAAGLTASDAERVVAAYELPLALDGLLLTEPAWAAFKEVANELVAQPDVDLILMLSAEADPDLPRGLVDYLEEEFLLDERRVQVSARGPVTAPPSINAILWVPASRQARVFTKRRPGSLEKGATRVAPRAGEVQDLPGSPGAR